MTTELETRLLQHLHQLAVNIGPRPVGSPANRAAGAYIAAVFERAGLDVEELRFDCPDWRHEATLLEHAGDRLEAAANMWSPACDVNAPTVAVCTVAELEAADLAGKVGVLAGELVQSPLTPKNHAMYQIERDQHINALLEAKRPAALLTVNITRPGMERLIEDRDLPIPSATVSMAAGLRLVQHSGEPVHLRIVSRREAGSSAHIVGTKAGTRPERLLLCAHYDSKTDTPGAWDNGSGVAVLLALAERLAREPLALGLELVAFGDEEYLGLDDIEYIRQRGDHLGSIVAAVNIDGVGQHLAAHSIMMAAHAEPFQTLLADLTRRYPGLVWVDPYPQSNHSTFAWRGVPSIAISSTPWSRLYHLPEDTVDWVSAAKLAEVVALVSDIVGTVQDKPLAWTRAAQPAY